jgi:asparagine synthase (glutamine-hydrolysing)
MLERLAHRNGATELSGFVDRRAKCQVVMGANFYDAHTGTAVVLDGAVANRDELRAWLAKRGYAFTGSSDAEILLKAYQYWDKDAIKHLRGAFAFALWDGRKERLMLARDRFGEKPLYLRETDGALYFASEPKALATPDAEVDLEAVWEHLACLYVPGPRTLVKGIRKLPPASYALWQFRKVRETRYWIPPDRNPSTDQESTDDPVEGFIERLGESVKLALPEKPGVFLSGGIDSAMIVALATQQGARVATFSAGFAEDKASELPAAARAAKHFGTEHYELTISQRDLIDRLPRLVAMRDAPLSRPSDVALHLLAVHAAKITPVVLTGDGGDEVLGGYRRHAAERFAWAFRGLPTLLALFAPLTDSPRLRAAAASLPIEDWRDRSVRWNGGLTKAQRGHLSVLGLNGSSLDSILADPAASALRRVLYFEQMSSLPDNLLERADRMTMAASVEARAPFLDHRLAEYVSALPDALRVRGVSTKWILHRALARLVPSRALSLRQGGWLPGGSLRGELGSLVRDHLTGPASLTRGYYEPKVLDRVLAEHDKGRKGHEELLWTLLNLEIWHRTRSAAHA